MFFYNQFLTFSNNVSRPKVPAQMNCEIVVKGSIFLNGDQGVNAKFNPCLSSTYTPISNRYITHDFHGTWEGSCFQCISRSTQYDVKKSIQDIKGGDSVRSSPQTRTLEGGIWKNAQGCYNRRYQKFSIKEVMTSSSKVPRWSKTNPTRHDHLEHRKGGGNRGGGNCQNWMTGTTTDSSYNMLLLRYEIVSKLGTLLHKFEIEEGSHKQAEILQKCVPSGDIKKLIMKIFTLKSI